MKLELPELENLYHSICQMDYYVDLSDKDVVQGKLEDDQCFNLLRNIDDKLLEGIEKLEKVPIKFSNQDEYMKIFVPLFYIEIKAQLSRSKVIEVLIKTNIKTNKFIKKFKDFFHSNYL